MQKESLKSLKSRMGKWAAWAAVCVIPALVAGCNGGTTGGGPFGNPVQNGTFNGAAANLGANRAGTLLIRTFSNNTINGTLTVAAPALVRSATSGNALVTLPVGTYSFTGTRTGSSFTGTGTIPGTTDTFTINGTLSTSTTGGSFTFTGTLNGETFEFGGTIAVFTGGGGGGGGNGSFTFSSNTSNANAGSFSALVGTGTNIAIGNARVLSATFASATSATNLRTVTLTISKGSSLSVGDTFPLVENEDPSAGQAVVIYTEGAPANKAWISNGGQVKITAIDGNNYTLQLTNATMKVAAFAGPGQTQQATGTFTLNGTGKALISPIVAP
ncbi:MAG TPA: hypothetical protein VGB77_23055 [Abditibacteriaceae bacterium]|jgi:hypothetical protein